MSAFLARPEVTPVTALVALSVFPFVTVLLAALARTEEHLDRPVPVPAAAPVGRGTRARG